MSAFEMERGEIIRGNQLLEAELLLARRTSTYVVFDLDEKSIQIKAKGLVLRKWEISRIKFWGDPLSCQPYSLIKKSAWFPPKRKKIMPGKNDEKKSFELDVFELKDMPSSYIISLEEGIRISIRQKTSNFFSKLRNFGKNVRWYAFLPLKTLWQSAKKRKFTEIDVLMASEKDAKALFWSFLEKKGCLIIPSR
ncbi:MAG: hypothetical protein WCC06_13345 [Candidatus Aminicenantales bacterium]